jgi:hypothetical protein
VIESAQAEAKAAAVEVVEENDAKYTAKVKAIAEEQNCREAVSLQSVTNESESWALECGDGKNVFVRCFDDEYYIKK